jgi:hypothetical protein
MRLNLLGGSYLARGLISDCQRCVNLYPEINPGDAAVPVTHYPTPGKTLAGTTPNNSAIRGLYKTSNQSTMLVAAGNRLYSANTLVSPMTFTELGALATSSGPVSMVDNGADVMIVDGSSSGYTVNLLTLAFSKINDPAFLGSNRVDYCDTFFVLSQPNLPTFYYSLSNSTSFDGLDFAQKTGFPDAIQAVAVIHSEVWLVGAMTSEVWYNAGLADAAFQRVPGALIEQGTPAPASVARISQNGVGAVFFVSQNREGEAMVMMGQGYEAKKVSTYAIDQALASYANISDAIGFCYQQAGHVYYQVSFPGADKTWVYDMSTGLWHEKVAIDSNGLEHRDWASCACGFGLVFAGDYRNGNIYILDPNAFTDNGQPVLRLRSFPHIQSDGRRIQYRQFIADMQAGTASSGLGDDALQVSLRYSDTRGASWGNPVMQTLGQTGDYLTQLQYQRLGMARDRVFELSWSAPVFTALNGAFVDYSVLGT